MGARSEPYRPESPIVPELSAGVVIIRGRVGPVFLLHEIAEDRWSLPKGHVDPGESLASAGLREVREETGFGRVALDGEICEVSYRFFHPKRATNVHKTVVYFLGRTEETQARLEPIFDRGEWVPLEEAEQRVRFGSDRTVLEAARARLASDAAKAPEKKK